MVSVLFVWAIVAFGTAVAALAGRCPVGVPVLLLIIVELLRLLPHGAGA